MNYLNVAQVSAIHSEVIGQTGGLSGIRDKHLLESAIARPQAGFGDKELYADIFSKVAALGYSLICSHPFVDGNKRSGYVAMRLFLNINGYEIMASVEEKYKFVMEIAKNIRKEKSIAEWLEKNTQRIK